MKNFTRGCEVFHFNLARSEQRHVPLGNGLSFGQPEDYYGGDEDGVFPKAACTAYLEGEAFLCKGDERCTVRGTHVQQAMRERPEAKAVNKCGRQRSHEFVEREKPEHEPPAEPV